MYQCETYIPPKITKYSFLGLLIQTIDVHWLRVLVLKGHMFWIRGPFYCFRPFRAFGYAVALYHRALPHVFALAPLGRFQLGRYSD